MRWFNRSHYEREVAQQHVEYTEMQRFYLRRLDRIIWCCISWMVVILGCVLYQMIWMGTFDGLAGACLSIFSILYLMHTYVAMRKRVKEGA